MTIWEVLSDIGKTQERERVLTKMKNEGYTNDKIANVLGTSEKEIDDEIKKMERKYGKNV